MSIDDNDNIYSIEEEDRDEDTSPRNFAAYAAEEREDEEEEQDEEVKPAPNAVACLFRIMFNPVEGWKLLRRKGISVEQLQSGCFYPILALLAISNFADYFYSVNVGLSQLVSEAVVSFVAFFFGYFCIMMFLSWVLPKEMAEKVEGKYGKEYIIISLSTLALFSIFTNILPMIWPILIFLPIWTLYLMFKGVRFFRFEEKHEMKFFVISGASAIGFPLLLEWILNTILPY